MKKLRLVAPFFLTGLTAFLLIVLGCNLGSIVNPPKASSPYLPLAAGNWWRYKDSDREWTAACNSVTKMGSEDVYVVTGAYYNLPENTYYYFDTSSLQGYVPVPPTNPLPPASTVLFTELVKVPFVAGQSYTNLVGTWTVESLTDTVTVPAGTFSNCLRLRIVPLINPYTDTHIFHLAPNVGLIRSENPSISHLIELQAYHIN